VRPDEVEHHGQADAQSTRDQHQLPKRAATAKAIALEATAIEIDVNGARIRLNARATAEQIGAVVSALRT